MTIMMDQRFYRMTNHICLSTFKSLFSRETIMIFLFVYFLMMISPPQHFNEYITIIFSLLKYISSHGPLIRFYFISFFKYIVQCHWFSIMVLGSLERENEMHYIISKWFQHCVFILSDPRRKMATSKQ